ncbi:Peptidase cysteine/serine, trypsin-like protein [Metarhizium album ARSEF 1941]|uniref:Peptidase cysteine/serine, trypsin-like protein n=1 Tax=Metarhizium album (strain ARSEF 1941) TaxID=1081103 RepID=A0A0B2WP67_METAS|nr:Peptidase cysteine/serine, trypsin-like protein [Metarhizium album ARSEF 1941]KHN95803.1 Peptidase cysteine/serine, trypsin-like protein [Metarhizium album ARSEF 1941]
MVHGTALQAVLLAVSAAAAAAATTMDKRIHGGEAASLADFPYFVKVGTGCGGSLLDSTTVVTAAHCWRSLRQRTYVESMGEPGLVSPVESMITHPNYLESLKGWEGNEERYQQAYGFDVAILKLSTPMEAGANVGYAKLPAADSPKPKADSVGIAVGWGRNPKERGNVAKVELPILKDCPAQGGKWPVKNAICTGNGGRRKSACHGDSGGPLVDKDTGVLIGITMAGSCGEYTSFTPVARHLAFIREKMNSRRPKGAPRCNIVQFTAGTKDTCLTSQDYRYDDPFSYQAQKPKEVWWGHSQPH